MDETTWRLIDPHAASIAQTGAESVAAAFDGNPKECLTVIATISAAGERLPLWIICKGTTTRCEKRFAEKFAKQIRKGELVLCHQCSGWTELAVARAYIEWLPRRCHGRMALISDLYSAHRCPETKTYAETVAPQLLFVPAGQTDT
jgi:hypothetical protein